MVSLPRACILKEIGTRSEGLAYRSATPDPPFHLHEKYSAGRACVAFDGGRRFGYYLSTRSQKLGG